MKQTIIVTAGIIFKNDHILVAQRKHDDDLGYKWEFPGGKLEKGESLKECLARELNEEFGITARVNNYLGESIYNYGNKLIHLKAYFVEHLSGEFQVRVHQNIQWVKLEKLHELDWAPADIVLVNKLLKHFKL